VTYTVMYTEEAAAKRDGLPPERRLKFDKGIEVLCQDPYTEVSHPIGGDWREVRLTSQIVIEYSVHAGQLVVIVVRIFDDNDVIIKE
jgi:mRNA-degrading endonuclease RelE of RelBE toxin-antitoxin system